MIRVAKLSLIAVLTVFLSQSAVAQDLLAPERVVRAETAAGLPDWWQLQDFEITEIGGEDLTTRNTGKVPNVAVAVPVAPEAPVDAPVTGKPGLAAAPLPTEQFVAFRATIELTQDLYEPLYSMDGAAFVLGIMEPGLTLEVTGTIGLAGSGDDIEFGAVMLDQAGLETLGKPMSEFEQPAFVAGSDEAAAFLDEAEATRAEGMFNKLMNDDGDEL